MIAGTIDAGPVMAALRMRFACRTAVLCFLLGGLAPGTVLAQSELVIHKQGTKLYHRAGCPVIKDGKGIVALTRAQAEARGFRAHEDCDPATSVPGATPTEPDPTVYLDGSKYYHRKSCKKLSGDAKAITSATLEDAGKKFWPCPTCKPPIRRRSAEPAVPGTERRGG